MAKATINPIALFIGGPLNGSRRGVSPDQQFVAWTNEDPFQGWLWAIYEFKARKAPRVYTYQWVGNAQGRQVEFEYRGKELTWATSSIQPRGEEISGPGDPEYAWNQRSLRELLEEYCPELLQCLHRNV